MTKHIILFTILFSTLIFPNFVFAQFDPKAEELLNAVSKKYEAIKSYKAEFTYELENQQAKVNDKFSGEINAVSYTHLTLPTNREV